MLQVKHDVTSTFYRSPAGPVGCGTFITFRVVVEENTCATGSVRLFYAYGLNGFRQGFLPMDREADHDGHPRFSCVLQMDEEPGLFFYWFEVRLRDGRYRWGFPDQDTAGTRAETLTCSPSFILDGSEPIPGFQVTVHDNHFKTPDWVKGAVQYQIFPDRYSRGSRFNESGARDLMKRPERIWHSDWNEEVDFEGKPPGGYQAFDFFGGTLDGIRENLPYLTSMGVTVLYLNPVFEAQSNHRYDTGDYLRVDPLLGTREDLLKLFDEARAAGIHVILDGVFSHTGSDSLYFNRYDRYDTVGAWQEMRDGLPSDYTSWYRFTDETDAAPRKDGGCTRGAPDEELLYECWWDFPCLPNVNEDDLSYRSFICGPDGVLAHWIRAGCAGYRLDVSDELPDSFLRVLRKRIKQERADALIVGEVWEEATAKISYGHHRDFLLGNSHDAVMGYPFRSHVLAFLKKEIDGKQLAFAFEKMVSITPAQALYAQMNLLGSHDTVRVITELAGPPLPSSREAQAFQRLTEEERVRGERLVVLASLFQLAFPGVMAVYYGDEIGMEGYQDPFNRRTFPQKVFATAPHKAMTRQIAAMMRLKNETAVLKTGAFEIFFADEDVLVFRRFTDGGRDAFGDLIDGPGEAVIAINRGEGDAAFPAGLQAGPLGGESGVLCLDGERAMVI